MFPLDSVERGQAMSILLVMEQVLRGGERADSLKFCRSKLVKPAIVTALLASV
jgi:hypothetical protein